jgi:predicted DNA-binding transcriptional regulator AlpA
LDRRLGDPDYAWRLCGMSSLKPKSAPKSPLPTLRAVLGAGLLASLTEPASAIEKAVSGAAIEDLPELEAWLARLGGLVRLRYVREPLEAAAPPPEDRLLTIEEAAERLSVKKAWLYQHHASLPFTVHVGAQHLRFSELGLAAWIDRAARSPR